MDYEYVAEKPKRGRPRLGYDNSVNTKISDEAHDRLRAEAEKRDVSLYLLLRDILESWTP